jgi:hypothetical protein
MRARNKEAAGEHRSSEFLCSPIASCFVWIQLHRLAYPPSSFRVRAFTAMPVPRSLLVPVPVVLALYAAFQSGAFPARPQWKKQQAQRDFEKVSRLIDAGWGDKVLVIPL